MIDSPLTPPNPFAEGPKAMTTRRVRLPAKGTFEAALDVLEAHVSHPDTMALHDAIYGAAQGRRVKLLEPVALAFARHRSHPAMPALLGLLGKHLLLPERTLGQVLVEDGPMPAGADLLEEVERRFQRASQVESVLRARVADLEVDNRRLARSSNVLAAVGGLLAVMLLLAWMVALDIVEVDWMEPPAPPEPEEVIP